jgi:hypothetical protein
MQVNCLPLNQTNVAANQGTLIVGVFLNDRAIQNGFNHVSPIKPLFDRVLNSVALNEIISASHSFTDRFDIHAALA